MNFKKYSQEDSPEGDFANNITPRIIPVDFDNVYWHIECPHCGKRHRHGNTGYTGAKGTHRLSHCIPNNDNEGYYIIWSKEIEKRIIQSRPSTKSKKKNKKVS